MHTRVTSADLAKIAALLATAIIMLLANGLQGTLVPVRAHADGFSATAISFMGAAYFAGFVAGCCFLSAPDRPRRPHPRLRRSWRALTGAIVSCHALDRWADRLGRLSRRHRLLRRRHVRGSRRLAQSADRQRHPRPHLHDLCGAQQSGAARRTISVHARRSALACSVFGLRDPDVAVPDPGRHDDAERAAARRRRAPSPAAPLSLVAGRRDRRHRGRPVERRLLDAGARLCRRRAA